MYHLTENKTAPFLIDFKGAAKLRFLNKSKCKGNYSNCFCP